MPRSPKKVRGIFLLTNARPTGVCLDTLFDQPNLIGGYHVTASQRPTSVGYFFVDQCAELAYSSSHGQRTGRGKLEKKMKASEIIAAVATKAQAANGAWVKQTTAAGEVEACSVKKHFCGSPFASFSTSYRLNGKRIALAKLMATLGA